MLSRENELRFIYLFFDLIILNLAILFVAWFSMNIHLHDYHQISIYLLHGNLALILTFFLFTRKNLYLRDHFNTRIKKITQRSLIFLLILGFLAVILLPKQYSRRFLFEYAGLFYLGKLVFYRFLYSFMKYKRRKGFNTIRVMIIGNNETTNLLKKIINNNPMTGYRFVGFASGHVSDPDYLGSSDQLDQLVKDHNIQMVIVSLSLISEEGKMRDYLNTCSRLGVRIRFLPENQRWFRSHPNMEAVGGLLLINPQEIPLDNMGHRLLKRGFDLLFSLALIVFLFSWTFPIIALAIKLCSKGPVFFAQKRTGINNKVFTCLKFRSMQVNKNADCQQATPGDVRITRTGKFIRKYNLDELPQFINVFWGQMSVIGPRPHMLKHTEEYSKLIDHYLVRHHVKPGISGWAQVNGLRGETDELWKMEERVRYDMDYIENWTFLWDMRIILMTMFGRKTFLNAI